MSEKETKVIRNEVINKAITYIFEHIDDELSIDDVAKYCGYSKYHLMRLFKEDTEEALYQFMKTVTSRRFVGFLSSDCRIL